MAFRRIGINTAAAGAVTQHVAQANPHAQYPLLASSPAFAAGAGVNTLVGASADNGQAAGLQVRTAGTARFQIVKGGASEAGGNSGSDLYIDRLDDTGTYLGSPLIITRATGLTALTSLAVSGNVGFYGTAAQAKQTVTGSKGANAALTSLLSKLAAIGLITDSST